jgi:hypothetical protein
LNLLPLFREHLLFLKVSQGRDKAIASASYFLASTLPHPAGYILPPQDFQLTAVTVVTMWPIRSPPWKGAAVVSALASYFLVGYRPDLLLFSRPSYIGTFALFWTLLFALWAFWVVILWPKLFSPLRHLPGPTEGRSWWNGYFPQISAEASGNPMIGW